MSAQSTRSHGRDVLGAGVVPWNWLPGLVASGLLVGLAFADGGFFPRAWSSSAVGVLWLATVTVLLRERLAAGRLELAFLAALAGFVAWTALSIGWSRVPHDSLLEVRRALVYVATAGLLVLLSTRRSVPQLVVAVWVAVDVVIVYALVRYLLLGGARYDVYQGNLLFQPLGYANAVGIFAGLGAVAAVALAAHAPTRALRSAAAASTAPLAAALYLSSSRGAWIAVPAGVLALLTLDPNRKRVAGALGLLTPAWAAVFALCSQSDLLDPYISVADAERNAHRLALWLFLVAVALVLARPLLDAATRRTAQMKTGAVAAALLLIGVAAAGVVAARGWSPHVTLGERSPYWHVAWREYSAHPWLGSGAGTFADYWERYGRPAAGGAVDAHNLYLETLAETGPVGLALLATALALPLLAARRARHHPLVPAAAGGYIAYLVHAALDWDWEMPAVTLAAIVYASAVLAAARGEGRSTVLSPYARLSILAATLGLAAFALVGLVRPA